MLTIRYERDDARGWVAMAGGVKGVGRSIEEARRRVCGAHRWEGAVIETFSLPLEITQALDEARELRRRAKQFTSAMNAALGRTAALLTKHHFSSRDAGSLLGISHTAISKLAVNNAGRNALRIEPIEGEFAIVAPSAGSWVNVFLCDTREPGNSLPAGRRVRVLAIKEAFGSVHADVDPLDGGPQVRLSANELVWSL